MQHNKITSIKKILGIFNKYGIQIMGKRKYDHFYKDLNIDKVFVDGLIFEVEYALEKELGDEYIQAVESPISLVKIFLEKASDPVQHGKFYSQPLLFLTDLDFYSPWEEMEPHS